MTNRYLCRLVFVLVSMAALCQGSRIAISATPITIVEGVTTSFTVRCSLEDDANSKSVSQVTNILITKDTTKRDVARIVSGQAAVAGSGATGAIVTGDLSKNVGYLQATWSAPGHVQAGGYHCEIVALEADGTKSKFKTNIHVQGTGQKVGGNLENLVAECKAEIDGLKKAINDLKTKGNPADKGVISETSNDISNLKRTVTDLKANIGRLSSPHNELGVVVCTNSDAWGEKMKPREMVTEVRFSVPYDKLPLVDISLVKLDLHTEKNARYQIAARDLTTTGFKVVCGTWWDTLVHLIEVRWTSSVG